MASSVNPGLQLASVITSTENACQEQSPESSRCPTPVSCAAEEQREPEETPPLATINSKLTQCMKFIFAPSAWTLSRFRLLSAYFALSCCGWHDGGIGSLLPYIQSNYNLTYEIVSMIFVGQCVGFLGASFSNTFLSDKLGLGKVLALGAVIQGLGYVLIIVPSLPFAVLVIMYALSGFGLALQMSQVNPYVASLPDSSSKLGWLHCCYGIGAFLSPLLSTSFVGNAFKFEYDPRENNIISSSLDNENSSNQHQHDVEMVVAATRPTAESEQQQEHNSDNIGSFKKLCTTLKKRIVIVSSLFLVIYVGAEVSIGGWIVSFLLDHRNGKSNVGYVSSGFWGGIAIGRVGLIKLNSWIGEKRAVHVYLVICAAFEISVWFAPNIIANGVAISIIGFFLGPFYPICVSLMTKILPRSLHSASVGFIAATGQVGSAIFPFFTGLLAQKFGISALNPILIVLFGLMGIVWTFMPSVDRRRE